MLVPANYNDDEGNVLRRSLSLKYDHLTCAMCILVIYNNCFAVNRYKGEIYIIAQCSHPNPTHPLIVH